MRRQPALAPPPHLLTNLLLACLLVAAGCGAASFSLGLWPQLGPPDNHHLGTVLASSDAAGGGAGDVAAAQAAPAQQRDSSSGGSSTACDRQAYLESPLADPRPGPAGSPAASRLPATLRYKAASGLCNQLYAHLAALAIAQHLGAQALVLPPARSRETFLRLHGWSLEPLESLLDTERMAAHWRSRGLRLEMVSSLAGGGGGWCRAGASLVAHVALAAARPGAGSTGPLAALCRTGLASPAARPTAGAHGAGCRAASLSQRLHGGGRAAAHKHPPDAGQHHATPHRAGAGGAGPGAPGRQAAALRRYMAGRDTEVSRWRQVGQGWVWLAAQPVQLKVRRHAVWAGCKCQMHMADQALHSSTQRCERGAQMQMGD